MNTKELWTALSLNSKTNPFFDGIFSFDTLLQIKKKPRLIICNTDPSSKPGTHWVLFFFGEKSTDYYDSLGNKITYYGSNFFKFIKRFSKILVFSKIRTQPVNTSLCGQYCLFYAYHKCMNNNIKMNEILKKMTNIKYVKDFVNKNFCVNTCHKSKFLQKCKNI